MARTNHRLDVLDLVALIVVIIGALNWLLVGFFGFNLVAAIFGPMTALSRLIYVIVGIAGVYVAVRTPHLAHMDEPRRMEDRTARPV